MTILVALSIACVAFIFGFCLGLMGIAMFAQRLRRASEHDRGADEGDQTSPFSRSGSSSLRRTG